MTASTVSRRAGFTLVELIVVISLAILITSLAVVVANSGAIGSQRVITSADRVSGWLITAKNRAKRDGRPRGVRFYRSATDPNLMSEAQYIELPDFVAANPTQDPKGMSLWVQRTIDDPGGTLTEIATRVFILVPPSQTLSLKNGDTVYIAVPGLEPQTLKLTGDPTTPTNSMTDPAPTVPTSAPAGSIFYELPLNATTKSNLAVSIAAGYSKFTDPASATGIAKQPNPTFSTTFFGFQPAVRTLFGEPVLQLSPDAVIDARLRSTSTPGNTNQTSLTVSTSGDFDVLFAPSGQVLDQTAGLIAFWVRDPNKPEGVPSLDPLTNFDAAGEQVLVAVYTKTGAVATHPVVSASTPYQAAKDGINAGF